MGAEGVEGIWCVAALVTYIRLAPTETSTLIISGEAELSVGCGEPLFNFTISP